LFAVGEGGFTSEGVDKRVSVRATSLLTADRILIGYFPAPHALASTAMHQVVLAFGRFSEFDKFANVSFRTTGSNVYGFSAEYWAGVFVFWNDCFLRFWRSYTIGEELNGS
jgi:hypothetical protein